MILLFKRLMDEDEEEEDDEEKEFRDPPLCSRYSG